MKYIALGFLVLLTGSSCRKVLKDVNDYFPKITTVSATIQADGTVLVVGEIESEGADPIRYLGFGCSTDAQPDMLDRQVIAEYTDGKFTAVYSGFDVDSVYYFRSWAANGFGYSYGNILSLGHILASPVDPPCTLSPNTVTIGGGQPTAAYYTVSGPTNSTGNWEITAATLSGPTVDLLFGSALTTGIYSTVDHTSPGPGEVFVSFYSGFISGSLTAGSNVYVNTISPGKYEITVCIAPWDFNGNTNFFDTRFTVPL